MPPLALLGAAQLDGLRRGAAAFINWFGIMAFGLIAVFLWLGFFAMNYGWPAKLAERVPVWNKDTMPEAVQRKHNTKVGTWGKITVLKGTLKFIELTEDGEVIAEHFFEAGADNPMAQPQAWHRVEAATEDVEWYLEFYCKPEDYFPKKYNTNPVHSEVLEAMQTVKPCKALNLGRSIIEFLTC